MIQLRDYQRAAIDSLYTYWSQEKGDPLVVAPCGAGKSIMIAQFIREAMSYPGTRILVLTHRMMSFGASPRVCLETNHVMVTRHLFRAQAIATVIPIWLLPERPFFRGADQRRLENLEAGVSTAPFSGRGPVL